MLLRSGVVSFKKAGSRNVPGGRNMQFSIRQPQNSKGLSP